MISPVLPLMALPLVLVMVLILTAGMRHIDIIVPTFLHKIDWLATRIVPGAMFSPVLGMAGGHVQVERWRGDNRGHGLDDDRLGVEYGRRWQGAEVNTAINVDRHPSSGTHRQSSSQDEGEQKASHTKSLYHDCIKSSMDYSLEIIPCSSGIHIDLLYLLF
jgi:hypothetical protein